MGLETVDLKAAAQAAIKQRKANAAARSQRAELIARLVDGTEAAKIPEVAYAAALRCMVDVLDSHDTLPLETRLDAQRAAETAKTLFTIARLASGESTSNIAHATVDPGAIEAIAERVNKLRGSNSP